MDTMRHILVTSTRKVQSSARTKRPEVDLYTTPKYVTLAHQNTSHGPQARAGDWAPMQFRKSYANVGTKKSMAARGN